MIIQNQLEKYLNKQVVIEEKNYQYPSTIHMGRMAGVVTQNETEGTTTAFDEDFVELDNTMLISRKFIYRIRLK